ncbi:hypothetical protein HHX48_15925 [Salinimonas sp. HHU 13199]|uniref:Uncharacterized protein n=1 Tax=Salinimonas profundi TaxID=2729140 RepID=A0ABR8LNR6_9ALTE|nr:hypothetical protein [Salinimonas profundi]MBD3587228.1 hypothetical protein [Salinimonas profundi]
MIEQISKLLENYSDSGVNHIHIEGFLDITELQKAARSLRPENILCQKIIAGEISLTRSEESYITEGLNVDEPNVLYIRCTQKHISARTDDGNVMVEPLQKDKPFTVRLKEIENQLHYSSVISEPIGEKLKDLGYEAALELYAIENPFTEESQAHELFEKGYARGMRELLNGV